MTKRHYSDCAVHNEPAMPNGECDCGGYEEELFAPFTEAIQKKNETIEKLKSTLKEIARQKLTEEMEEHEQDGADYQYGYEEIVKTARKVLEEMK